MGLFSKKWISKKGEWVRKKVRGKLSKQANILYSAAINKSGHITAPGHIQNQRSGFEVTRLERRPTWSVELSAEISTDSHEMWVRGAVNMSRSLAMTSCDIPTLISEDDVTVLSAEVLTDDNWDRRPTTVSTSVECLRRFDLHPNSHRNKHSH